MHAVFSALFALLFSICHHGATAPSIQTAAVYQDTTPEQTLSFPDRHVLARVETAQYGYAGSACDSCRGMNVSFTAR